MEPTLQTILLIGFAAYAASHCLPAFIHKAAWCIMNCRTAVMGGHVQACPEGHFERSHYNSCKHRICPKCAFIQVEKWLTKQKARILACDHYHVIFTIPHELNFLWRFNQRVMANILFQSATNTIFQLLKDEKYLGAKPGIIASLHTWTKKLELHPHIHCLVTGGGLALGKWKKLRYDYLFPFPVASALFQGKILDAIVQAFNRGELQIPQGIKPRNFRKLIDKLWRKKWDVNVREKYSHGNAVLTYLAKYLRGGPISNRRIIKVDNNTVTFNVGREKKELLTLPIAGFIERYIQHIPQPSSIMIRSYGIYSSTNREGVNLCRKLLGQNPVEDPLPTPNWQDILEDKFADPCEQRKQNPWLCPVCGKRLIVKSTIPPNQITKHSGDPPCPNTYHLTA